MATCCYVCVIISVQVCRCEVCSHTVCCWLCFRVLLLLQCMCRDNGLFLSAITKKRLYISWVCMVAVTSIVPLGLLPGWLYDSFRRIGAVVAWQAS